MIGFDVDQTFTHECDTTRGDSGSPFMVRNGDQYELVGVDSRFRSNPGGSFIMSRSAPARSSGMSRISPRERIGANGRRVKN